MAFAALQFCPVPDSSSIVKRAIHPARTHNAEEGKEKKKKKKKKEVQEQKGKKKFFCEGGNRLIPRTRWLVWTLLHEIARPLPPPSPPPPAVSPRTESLVAY